MLSTGTAVEPRAWFIEYFEGLNSPPDGAEAIAVLDPRTMTALLTPISPSNALLQAGAVPGALTIIWMPPGASMPDTMEREVQAWIRDAGPAHREVNVRAEVRTVRVAWGESRAVVHSSEGDLAFALDAVVRFSVAQREALVLEEQMRATWATLESDTALTHALTLRELKRQPHVNEMTEKTTRMKMEWLRIFRCLEQFEPDLTDPSKRIFAELASAASLYDRMETLENTIQFALDHYEISNTRLIDMYSARTDRVNSIFGYGIITILLLIQIWIMVYEAGLLTVLQGVVK